MGVIHARLEVDWWEFARIQVHLGKTQVWNRGGHHPPGRTQLTAAAQAVDPHARVWCGDGEPGVVRSELRKKTVLRSVLFERIPAVQDLESLYCANTRASYWLRGVPPEEVAQFASEHDAATQSCLSRHLGAGLSQDAHDLASLPFSIGGCGLRSACRSKVATHWASWADSLRMIHQRLPDVVALMVRALSCPSPKKVDTCRLLNLAGCSSSVLVGLFRQSGTQLLKPAPRFLATVEYFGNEPGVPTRGWQFEASASVGPASPFSPLPFTSGLTRCSLAFFSSVVFVFLFLFRLVPAGVAVLSTSLATTVRLEDADPRMSLLRHASAVKLGLVSPPIFSCGTWTWLLLEVLTVVALKWSRRGSRGSAGHRHYSGLSSAR